MSIRKLSMWVTTWWKKKNELKRKPMNEGERDRSMLLSRDTAKEFTSQPPADLTLAPTVLALGPF